MSVLTASLLVGAAKIAAPARRTSLRRLGPGGGDRNHGGRERSPGAYLSAHIAYMRLVMKP
ncbi:hypothetical protein GCM10023107_46760 [Actinoplanes octamycinicus]